MADNLVERFNVTLPARYQGIGDFAPNEIQEFAGEIQRRLDVNQSAIINALRSQVVVQKNLLPTVFPWQQRKIRRNGCRCFRES